MNLVIRSIRSALIKRFNRMVYKRRLTILYFIQKWLVIYVNININILALMMRFYIEVLLDNISYIRGREPLPVIFDG